jgi:hypothetical protein
MFNLSTDYDSRIAVKLTVLYADTVSFGSDGFVRGVIVNMCKKLSRTQVC